MLQKRAPKDFITKQPDKNVPFESNYLVDDHEPVIDRLTWDAVQNKLRQRREDIDSGVRYHGGRTHFLYGKIFCGGCGAPMTRRTLREYSKGNDIRTYKAWTCKEHHKGRRGNGCMMRTIRETDLLAAISHEMGHEQFDPDQFAREVEKVAVNMGDVEISRLEVAVRQ